MLGDLHLGAQNVSYFCTMTSSITRILPGNINWENVYQNEIYINQGEKQYLDLLKNILYKNNIKDSRNSKVISQFG